MSMKIEDSRLFKAAVHPASLLICYLAIFVFLTRVDSSAAVTVFILATVPIAVALPLWVTYAQPPLPKVGQSSILAKRALGVVKFIQAGFIIAVSTWVGVAAQATMSAASTSKGGARLVTSFFLNCYLR